MQYARALNVLLIVWAVVCLFIASMAADTLRNESLLTAVFLWCLSFSAVLVPFAHAYIEPQRPFRRVLLFILLVASGAFAFSLSEGYRTDHLLWIPLLWIAAFTLGDWLLTRSSKEPENISNSQLGTIERMRLRDEQRSESAIERFDSNVEDFKVIILSSFLSDRRNVQIGSLSSQAVIDFIATKLAIQASFAAFFIVFQRIYGDPQRSKTFHVLLEHAKSRTSQVAFAQQKAESFVMDRDIEQVWEIVNAPRYRGERDELRLGVAFVGLFVGMELPPPLTEDDDRVAMGRLAKRTLNRMRSCLRS